MSAALAVTLTIDELRELVRDAVREIAAPDTTVMTRPEVAKLLKVSERTVVSYVEKEKLPASKLPNGWRFFRTDVVAWIDRLIRNGVKGTKDRLFLHRSCKPIDEVDLSTPEERGQTQMFQNECEGMCGV